MIREAWPKYELPLHSLQSTITAPGQPMVCGKIRLQLQRPGESSRHASVSAVIEFIQLLLTSIDS